MGDGRLKVVIRKPAQYEVVDDEMAAVLRAKTEQERMEMGFAMWRFARDLMRSAITGEHPDWTDEAIQREVAKRMSHGAVDVRMTADGEFHCSHANNSEL